MKILSVLDDSWPQNCLWRTSGSQKLMKKCILKKCIMLYSRETHLSVVVGMLSFLWHHLSKWAFPNQWVYLIAVQPLFSIFNNVVVVVIVVAIIVNFSLLLGAAVFWRDLLGPPLLLSIIHLRMWDGSVTGRFFQSAAIILRGLAVS